MKKLILFLLICTCAVAGAVTNEFTGISTEFTEVLFSMGDRIHSMKNRGDWTLAELKKEAASNYKRGYMVRAEPAGFDWGDLERNPKYFGRFKVPTELVTSIWFESITNGVGNVTLLRKKRLLVRKSANALLSAEDWQSVLDGTLTNNLIDGSSLTWSDLPKISTNVVYEFMALTNVLHGSAGTFTIKSSGGDYTTLTAWNAAEQCDLTAGGGLGYSIAHVYNDFGSGLDDAVTVDGWTTDADNGIVITAPVGQRHDGTVGSGARIVRTGDLAFKVLEGNVEISWLEIDLAGNEGAGVYDNRVAPARTLDNFYHHLICHGSVQASGTSGRGNGIMVTDGEGVIHNCIVYNITQNSTGTADAHGIRGVNINRFPSVYNCTVWNIINNLGSGDAEGISIKDAADEQMINNISTGVGGTSSGPKLCFSPTNLVNLVSSNNLSSDASAEGTGSLNNKAAVDQFVSISGGTTNLQLKTGSSAIGAALTLTTPTEITTDIGSTVRSAPWDMGAWLYAASALTTNTFLITINDSISTIGDEPIMISVIQ